jgi:hypothetical protein
MAQQECIEADGALDIFGDRALRLREIADYIVRRNT